MDEDQFECATDLKPWKLTWVDPAMWVMSVVNGFGQTITNTTEVVVEALLQHAKWQQQAADFRREAGLAIEALTSPED